jgi:vacuolar-type H+-ATPase subunit H
MREVIEKMLEIERRARRIVAKAEAESARVTDEARAEARRKVEAARQDALARVDAIINDARTEAAQEKDTRLAQVREAFAGKTDEYADRVERVARELVPLLIGSGHGGEAGDGSSKPDLPSTESSP